MRIRFIIPVACSGVLVSTVAILTACGRSSEGPKIPLAQATSAAGAAAAAPDPRAASGLSATAIAMLDSGNRAFRAKQYAAALGAYRAAQVAAPTDVAPAFGLYMVARKQGNKALADSAVSTINKLSSHGSSLNDSTMRALHAGAKVSMTR